MAHVRPGLLLLVLLLAVPVGDHATAAPPCESLDAYVRVLVAEPRDEPELTTIPVAIHFMERPGPGPEPECAVRRLVTSEQLRVLFDPNHENRRSVNSPWAAARIRFVVTEIIVHAFAPPPALRQDPSDPTVVKIPEGQRDAGWEDEFRELVARFHRPRSLNLYLWRSLTVGKIGFARSRTIGFKSTAWLGAVCFDRDVEDDCARAAAHEFGHALGLYHVKMPQGADACRAVEPEFRPLCRTVTTRCGESNPGDRLMAQGSNGRRLCPAEAREARRTATRLQ